MDGFFTDLSEVGLTPIKICQFFNKNRYRQLTRPFPRGRLSPIDKCHPKESGLAHETSLCVYISMCVCMCLCGCVHACAHVYAYVFMHACLYACKLQDLKKAGVLIFANKQDLKGSMSSAEISQELNLASIKDHGWHIQGCCALTGEGLVNYFITGSIGTK